MVTKLNRFLFQCDECHYAHTAHWATDDAFNCPLPVNWTSEFVSTEGMPTLIRHYCVPCSEKRRTVFPFTTPWLGGLS